MKPVTSLPPQTAARMRQSLEFCDALVGEGREGLVAYDRELRIIYWSEALEQITGLSREEVLGRALVDAFPVQGAPHVKALEGTRVRVAAWRFAPPSAKQLRWLEATFGPLPIDGEILGGVALVRDVTERKQAEADVRESEGRFRNMADASPVLLWMSGTDGLCNFFNQTWLDFTGRTLEEEAGIGWAEGVHYEDFQRCMDTYLDAFNKREAFEMEYRLQRKDGEYRWILDRGVPRYAPDGTFEGYIGSCADITERRQLETELRRAVSARDDFISIAAHELRTPLTPMKITLEGLLRSAKPAVDQPLISKLERLARQILRQKRLVESLLDVSHLTSGPIRLEPEPLDLAALVKDTVAQLEEDVRQADVDLSIRSTEARGVWDRARLEQILVNLLLNALKYGAGKPIEVEVASTDGDVVLSVRDRGIGISDDDARRIFERFERAVSRQHYSGFGLGLWITRTLVEAMGGKVDVRSQPGEGSTFTVRLPRGQAPKA